MTNMHVGKRIRELMKRRGVERKEVGDWLQISESAVDKLLTRESQKTEDLYVLADNMGIPIESFVAVEVRETADPAIAYSIRPKRSLQDCELALATTQERLAAAEARLSDKDELIQVLKSTRG